jgi:hypothetical protein
MSTASSIGSVTRSAIFLLLAISGAALLPSCADGSDDPPADISTTATIDDYIGQWTDGTTTNIEIARNASVLSAGDFTVSSTFLDPVVGTMVISSGKAALTTTQSSMSYDSSTDRIVYALFTLTRVGASTGSVIGNWAYSYNGTVVISASFSGSAPYGAIVLNTFGSSKTGTYSVSGSAVSIYTSFGSATMNTAKDKITLDAEGEAAPMVLTKGTIPLEG